MTQPITTTTLALALALAACGGSEEGMHTAAEDALASGPSTLAPDPCAQLGTTYRVVDVEGDGCGGLEAGARLVMTAQLGSDACTLDVGTPDGAASGELAVRAALDRGRDRLTLAEGDAQLGSHALFCWAAFASSDLGASRVEGNVSCGDGAARCRFDLEAE